MKMNLELEHHTVRMPPVGTGTLETIAVSLQNKRICGKRNVMMHRATKFKNR
jgi:hypothetical protein